MLIVLPKSERIITAVEGTGDNLLHEDRVEGYVDYWLSSIYEIDGEEVNLIDSGQILTSTLISEMTADERVQRVLEYWEAGSEPHQLAIAE